MAKRNQPKPCLNYGYKIQRMQSKIANIKAESRKFNPPTHLWLKRKTLYNENDVAIGWVLPNGQEVLY